MDSAARDFKGLATPPQTVVGPQSSSKSPFGGLYGDPRTSSTQSLTPSLPAYEEIERRKLLVIYIHGFMGNDTSFQSFPAHVHRYLKLALADSHVVHSKIYPRYKTYKSIDVARDNFSAWLEPLENPKTDVILVGHSMGGLLAADVVLKQPTRQHQYQPQYGHFKHRILGTVNLDSPLLGMQPGIIVSGISSLFRKNETPKVPGEVSTPPALSPDTAGLPSPSLSTYSGPSMLSDTQPFPPPPPAPFMRPSLTHDANFNPNLPNDVRIEERTWWGNVVHFVKKHNSEGLIDAAANHMMSHMEFGGSMFDFNSLKTRYESVRRLEDLDDLKQSGFHMPPQVRFIQYYTICNGFPKKPKAEDPKGDPERDDARPVSAHDDLEKGHSSPRLFSSGPSQNETYEKDHKPISLPNSTRSSLELLNPEPIPDDVPSSARNSFTTTDDATNTKSNSDHISTIHTSSQDKISSPTNDFIIEDKVLTTEITHAVAALDLDLPAIPDLPPQPDPLVLENYADKDARKLAEKEAKRVQKAYTQAVKDREKAIRDREKIIEKRRKKLAQEAEKRAKEDEKRAKEEKKRRKKDEAAATATQSLVSPTVSEVPPSASAKDPSDQISQVPPPEWRPVSPDTVSRGTTRKRDKEKMRNRSKDEGGEEKKQTKQRKFCNVPKSHGQVDPKWVSVFMKDMDEVAAHTSLFFAGEHYEGLVGEVGNTIVEWVQADMTKRTILGLQ